MGSPPERVALLHSTEEWLPVTQNWMYQQARGLPDWLENHVVCEWTQNLDLFELGTIHSLAERWRPLQLWDKGLRRLGVRRHPGQLARVARKTGARILHSHFGHVGWQNCRMADRLGLRHVVTFYGRDVCLLPRQDPVWKTRYRELFERVDLVLCEGPHMANEIKMLGCPSHRIRVHELGIDTSAIPFEPRRLHGDEPLKVLIAATFTEKKGIPYAIQAVARAAEKIAIEVTIVGDANADPRSEREKQRILGLIEELGLADRVRLLGYQSQESLMREAYAHHVFLSPSVTAPTGDTEGGAPICIIELAASGMPIVSSRHCDIPYAIENGVGGLLSAERDVHGLAEHLISLAEQPKRWDPMVRAARDHIEARYDLGVRTAALAGHYESLL